MQWIKLFILTILVVNLMVLSSTAQDDPEYTDDYIDVDEYLEPEYEPIGMFISLDLDVATPVFYSRDNGARTSVGAQFQILYQLMKSSPVFMGLAFSFGQYDKESIEYYDFTEFEENLFRETAHCNFLHLDLKSRYFPGWTFSVFEPFVDLSIGARNSLAYTTLTNVDYDENVNTYFNDSDWGFQYGIGLGTLINMNELISPNVFIHYSMNYTGGENSFIYLEKQDISGFEDPIDRFERKSIPYQYLKFDLGLIFHF